MAYCINCGNKLSEKDKFCEKCGEKVVQDNEPKIEENIMVEQLLESNIPSKNETLSNEIRPKKNKFSTILKWTIGVIISLIIFCLIGYLNEEPYPKNYEEMSTLLTNKCWKPKKIEIKSINHNGEYISNPKTDDVRQSLTKAVQVANGTDKSYIWENFQKVLDESTKDNYNFIRFTKHSDGKFLYYTQSFDKEINLPKYDFNIIDIVSIDNKYEFNYNCIGDYTFSGQFIPSGWKSDKENNKIIGLSSELLKIKIIVEAISESNDKYILEIIVEYENKTGLDTANFENVNGFCFK